MPALRLGVITVVTTSVHGELYAHARHIGDHFPEWKLRSACIPDQPTGVHDRATHEAAEPKVADLAERLAAEGVDAIYVSCAADPGVAMARARLPDLPILGAGRAGALLALAYEVPVGILGISDAGPEPMVRTLGPALVAVDRPSGVETALDLRTERGRSATLAAAERLVRRGARLILYGCTGMSTLAITAQIHQAHGVPVVDPDLAAAGLLFAIVRQPIIARTG